MFNFRVNISDFCVTGDIVNIDMDPEGKNVVMIDESNNLSIIELGTNKLLMHRTIYDDDDGNGNLFLVIYISEQLFL